MPETFPRFLQEEEEEEEEGGGEGRERGRGAEGEGRMQDVNECGINRILKGIEEGCCRILRLEGDGWRVVKV